MTATLYGPGDAVGLVAPRAAALVHGVGTDDELTRTLWSAMRTAESIEPIAGALVASGLDGLPSLAVVVLHEDGDATLLVRGDARVVVDPADGGEPLVVDATDVATWVERRLHGVAALTLGDADGAAPTVPVAEGVVLAGCVRRVVGEIAAPVAVPLPSEVEPADGEPAAVERLAEDIVGTMTFGVLDVDGVVDDAAPSGTPVETQADPEPAPGLRDRYAFLFGHTQNSSVEAAAVRVDAAADESPPPVEYEGRRRRPDSHTQAEPTDSAAPAAPVAPTPPAPSSPSVPGGLITQIPGAAELRGRPAPVPAQEPSAPPPVAEEQSPTDIERTVMRASARSAAVADGPTVHAVLCDAGHPNPAHAQVCRVCELTLAECDPLTMPRPVLGSLRFSSGELVVLDRDVLIGRSPQAHRESGEQLPHLVVLPSPTQEISRSHVEVRLDGWHVLVSDLNSTNGTIVTAPGRPPKRLRSGEPEQIPLGTVVSVADEVTFVYEVGA